MASVNKAILIGNLGKDPEMRYTPSGQAVTTFSIATSEKWRDKEGQQQERTDWHNIVVWDARLRLPASTSRKDGRYISKAESRTAATKIKTATRNIFPRSWFRGCNS